MRVSEFELFVSQCIGSARVTHCVPESCACACVFLNVILECDGVRVLQCIHIRFDAHLEARMRRQNWYFCKCPTAIAREGRHPLSLRSTSPQ